MAFKPYITWVNDNQSTFNWDDLARDLANDYNVLSVREGVAIFLR